MSEQQIMDWLLKGLEGCIGLIQKRVDHPSPVHYTALEQLERLQTKLHQLAVIERAKTRS